MADSNITQSDDDRLIDEMANFGPAFDDETMQQLEKSALCILRLEPEKS